MRKINPGKKFMSVTDNNWKQEVYDKVVHKTRRNLVPYNDIQRVLMYCRGDMDKASEFISKKQIPSNPDVMMDFYNRLCDLETVVEGCCAVLAQKTGYDPNQITESED